MLAAEFDHFDPVLIGHRLDGTLQTVDEYRLDRWPRTVSDKNPEK